MLVVSLVLVVGMVGIEYCSLSGMDGLRDFRVQLPVLKFSILNSLIFFAFFLVIEMHFYCRPDIHSCAVLRRRFVVVHPFLCFVYGILYTAGNLAITILDALKV